MDTRSLPRLLLLADSLSAGGRERQTIALLKGLRCGGRFAALLGVLDAGGALQSSAELEASGLVAMPRRMRYDVSPLFALSAAIGRERIDLIQATGWMSGWIGLLAARWRGIPLVYANIADAPARLHRRARLSRACARRADVAVANSKAALDAYGLRDLRRAVVIANGVDLEPFAHLPAPNGTPRICMVANFNRRKDHHTVVRALALVRRREPAAQLWLIGQDGGTLKEVRDLACDLGVGEAVQFVTDSIAPERFLAAAHVCVLSSPSESASNALLEYMGAARPVVASRCAGNAEIVVEGETGFLVPFASAGDLADRIVALLRDPDRTRAMGEAGRQRVERQFSQARMVAAYEDLYARLLQR